MFSLLYNYLELRMVAFVTKLRLNVYPVAQSRQTKHWLWREPFMFLAGQRSFSCTIGRAGRGKGYIVGCNLHPHH